MDPVVGRAFLDSAERTDLAPRLPDPDAWLAARAAAQPYEVRRVPLAALPRWHLGDDLAHDTRRFFTVEGLAVATSFGDVRRWSQPIIHQPEIGILGFLAKQIGGTLHLLAQAKMEPGNRTMVQISPTVQATPSNYTRVHGGRATPFLEHFVGDTRGRVLVDLLQSEQGSRYYRKRNRSMIVELPEDAEIAHGDDFAWLTLRQLRALLAHGDRLNMNARSVLACAFHAGEPPRDESLHAALLRSHLDPVAGSEVAAALGWLADVKTATQLDVHRIKLGELEGWICDADSIRHESGRFFRVIGVDVRAAAGREVAAWQQPMLEPVNAGTVVLACQRRRGRLELLVQARAEAGLIDGVELGATLQLSPGNYTGGRPLPPLAHLLDPPAGWIRFRAAQADDGGRFYHDDNLHVVVELPEDEAVDAPPNYRWMTLALLQRLMRHGYLVNIELRSVLACLL